MNRIFALIIGTVMLVCISSKAWAQCFGGYCLAPGASSAGVSSFGAFGAAPSSGYFSESTATYGRRRLFGRRRLLQSTTTFSSGEPMSFSAPMTFSAPTTFGDGGGCYGGSYSAARSYSVPMSYSAPATFSAQTAFGNGGGCYGGSYSSSPQAYSVPMVLVPAQAVPQNQATPSAQSQSSPQLPSKSPPAQEYTPGSRRAPQASHSIRRVQPPVAEEVLEKPPQSRIGCFGPCCGNNGECECGEKCLCESPPRENAPAPRKKRSLFAQVYDQMDARFVDYSEMTNVDTSLVVDYSGLSNKARAASEASRRKVAARTTR